MVNMFGITMEKKINVVPNNLAMEWDMKMSFIKEKQIIQMIINVLQIVEKLKEKNMFGIKQQENMLKIIVLIN